MYFLNNLHLVVLSASFWWVVINTRPRHPWFSLKTESCLVVFKFNILCLNPKNSVITGLCHHDQPRSCFNFFLIDVSWSLPEVTWGAMDHFIWWLRCGWCICCLQFFLLLTYNMLNIDLYNPSSENLNIL